MIGNNDIFDEEELLAIANDGGDGSSSSSCHSMSEDEDTMRSQLQPSSSPPQEIPGDGDAFTSTNKETTLKTESEEHDGSDSSDSDSDSDDDGFLESWFETEKKVSSEAVQNSSLGDATNVDLVNTDQEISKATNVTENNTAIDQSGNGTKVELGSSALEWIASTKRKTPEGRTPSIVAVQHNKDATLRASTIRLTTSTQPSKKRSRLGNEYSKATLEEITGNDQTSEGGVQCGRVIQTSSNAEGSSTPGEKMVDCIARYDYQKGCYVLDMVDLIVQVDNEMEHMQERGAGAEKDKGQQLAEKQATATNGDAIDSTASGLPKQSQSDVFDPRSIARRAEEQIRKLKRGKGRKGGSKTKR